MFTCKFVSCLSLADEVADLTNRGLELVSYKRGTDDAEIVVQFPNWHKLVDFAHEHFQHSNCSEIRCTDDQQLYRYLLKYARAI